MATDKIQIIPGQVCKFDECAAIVAQDFWGSPKKWGIFTFIVLTVLFIIITVFGIAPQDEPDEKKRAAKKLESASIYFGVVCNVILMLFCIICYWFASRGYHLKQAALHSGLVNPYFSPVVLTVLFFLTTAISITLWLVADDVVGNAPSALWIAVYVGGLMVGTLLVFLLLKLTMQLRMEVTPAQLKALTDLAAELRSSVEAKKQNLIQRAAALTAEEKNLQDDLAHNKEKKEEVNSELSELNKHTLNADTRQLAKLYSRSKGASREGSDSLRQAVKERSSSRAAAVPVPATSRSNAAPAAPPDSENLASVLKAMMAATSRQEPAPQQAASRVDSSSSSSSRRSGSSGS